MKVVVVLLWWWCCCCYRRRLEDPKNGTQSSDTRSHGTYRTKGRCRLMTIDDRNRTEHTSRTVMVDRCRWR
uniref:Putative secreted protein n=1 Tax=Anopheles darlingi TaxID=43151 RepID=A0A2M4DCJ7_ANODA